MKINDAIQAVDALSLVTQSLASRFTYRAFQPGAPFSAWYSRWPTTLFGASGVSDPKVTGQYGAYLVAEAATGTVTYIGKATPRVSADAARTRRTRYHLAAEIWSKMRTPTGSGAAVKFARSTLLKSRVTSHVRQAIVSGDVLIAAISIDPWPCSALVETYLQGVAFMLDGALPLANDQIG